MLYLASGVLCVGSSENQLERFGEEDRRCRSSAEFAWAANKQLPKRADTLYLWPWSKGWMQAVKRTFNLQRLKSQI